GEDLQQTESCFTEVRKGAGSIANSGENAANCCTRPPSWPEQPRFSIFRLSSNPRDETRAQGTDSWGRGAYHNAGRLRICSSRCRDGRRLQKPQNYCRSCKG